MVKMFWIAVVFAALVSVEARINQQSVLDIKPKVPNVVTPTLCNDTSTHPQYSGYLPGSSIFFWFFPSRSDPSVDPIGVWSNGGPGSSALTGMQYAGPCEVVKNEDGVYEMQRRERSLNQEASILMIDNPMGSGFSYAPFPSVDSTFDSAKQTYDFLQSFFKAFPEYTSNPLAVNSLSYGGHYAPVYSSYIQHMNAQLDDESSLWTDIWPTDVPRKTDLRLNLTSLSVGNGWINGRKQYRSLVDFACSDEIPILADKNDCKWARDKVAEAEILLDTCSTKLECAAVGSLMREIATFPYTLTGLNNYDYRTSIPYDETSMTFFYNDATVQSQLGVIALGEQAKLWEAHSPRVYIQYTSSGDWDVHTDVLFERLLRSGVSLLVYEGMVDWICNYFGIREIVSSLPNYQHQQAFNNLTMHASDQSGAYKCLRSNDQGNFCYFEMDGAGHITSLDKPVETSNLLSRWMRDQEL